MTLFAPDSTEERPYELNLVRLLRFLSGEIYHKTPYTAQSFYELGKYAARMTNVLSVLYFHVFIDLNNLHHLHNFL